MRLWALLVLPAFAAAQQQECECVDYWLCENNRIVTDGTDLLDIRQKQCPGVEVCCLPPDDTTQPSAKVTPTPFPVDPITLPSIPDDEGPVRIPSVASGGGCGRRRIPPGTGFKVTGANGPPEKTFYGEAPWMVVLLREQQGGRPIFTCGGTLITPRIVLTAAHCINGSLEGELSVRAGEYDNRVPTKPLPVQTVRVSRISIHPQYNSGNLHNDIALLFLQAPMQTNEVVDVICGPDNGDEIIPRACFVTGWGRNSTFGRYQAVLSKVNLELRDREYCQNSLRNSRLGRHFKLHEGFICAGGGDSRDTCTGDGGGPLVCPSASDPNKLVQVGIVAWGIGCGEGYPTVLVSVKHYIQWIGAQVSSFP